MSETLISSGLLIGSSGLFLGLLIRFGFVFCLSIVVLSVAHGLLLSWISPTTRPMGRQMIVCCASTAVASAAVTLVIFFNVDIEVLGGILDLPLCLTVLHVMIAPISWLVVGVPFVRK